VPVYSVNRRRAIILLVLSSVLLLTLDLRGNPVIDRMRSVFSRVLTPFETAGEVIATPIRNAWHGATDYQSLARENEKLRDELARGRGDQLAARAIYGDYQELLTLNGLTAKYPTTTARVVGGAPGNFRQTVEIDRGSSDGILVGMPVVNFAGLVGKVTKVYDNRSVVLLVTDSDYTIECKVSGVDAAPVDSSSTPLNSTPSGINRADLSTTTTQPLVTTTPTTAVGRSSANANANPGATTTTGVAGTGSGTTSSSTAPALVERETGGCQGRGPGRLSAMHYITENPVFGTINVGAVISTTGGSKSLAPPDIIIGEVINKIERSGSAGPILEIKLGADLNHLNLVQIVRYRPPPEVPSG